MKADLHLHSRFSDGGLWPAELAVAANTAGMDAVALTDHDNLAGSAEFIAAAERFGMRAWVATEIDCIDTEIGYKSEILAYFPKGQYRHTEDLLRTVKRERRTMVASLFASAASVFGRKDIDFPEYERSRLSGRPDGAPPIGPEDLRYGKTDIYFALKQAGVLASGMGYRRFKKVYLKSGLLSRTKVSKLKLSDVCKVVLKDGGYLTVPHIGHEFGDDPDRIRNQVARLDMLMAHFRALGVGAIESYAYGRKQEAAINEFVAERARAHGFFITYGSDDHGPASGKRTIGLFYGNFAGFPHEQAISSTPAENGKA